MITDHGSAVMQEDVAAIGVLMAVGLKMLIQAQIHLGTISTALSIAQYCMLLPPTLPTPFCILLGGQ